MIEKEWIKKVKSVHPKADEQVLQFIYDFRTMLATRLLNSQAYKGCKSIR